MNSGFVVMTRSVFCARARTMLQWHACVIRACWVAWVRASERVIKKALLVTSGTFEFYE